MSPPRSSPRPSAAPWRERGEKPRFFIQAADRFVTTPEGPTWKQPEGWPQHCEAEFITVTPPLARWDKAQELAWLSNVPDEIKHVYKIREQLLQQDHWSKMQRILLKGSETLPNPPVLAYLYAQSLASENRLGEAADFLRSKIASGADAATLPLAYLLTELLIEASAPTEALEVARKALERHPDDRWLRANVDIVNGTPLRLKKIPVILLAGGFGTRLSSVVSDRPKCLAEVCGHPFLHYILEQISASGCERLFISVHHLADQIRRAIGPRHRGMAVAYVEEPKPLGTGGGDPPRDGGLSRRDVSRHERRFVPRHQSRRPRPIRLRRRAIRGSRRSRSNRASASASSGSPTETGSRGSRRNRPSTALDGSTPESISCPATPSPIFRRGPPFRSKTTSSRASRRKRSSTGSSSPAASSTSGPPPPMRKRRPSSSRWPGNSTDEPAGYDPAGLP